MITNILLAILFGAALTLAGAETEPWQPGWNIAGALIILAGAAAAVYLYSGKGDREE